VSEKSEFFIAMIALAGVLTSGLLRGVLIGAVISLLLLIRRASRPHVAFLGRIPGTNRYSDAERHPDNEPIPGLLIFRCEGSIVYFNADHVRESVMAKVRQALQPPHSVLCDLSAAAHMDIAGAEMLKELAAELKAMNIQLRLVEARSKVRDRLRAEGLEDRIGRVDRFTTVHNAVEAIQTGEFDNDEPGHTT
jgi:MFS superfamily sulfate permease-like transporter